MRIIGVDLHARQQTIAMLDTETGELIEKTLGHDGEHSAIHGAREWIAAGPLLMEPGRPTRTPGVVPGSPCEPTKDRFAEFVSPLPGIDR